MSTQTTESVSTDQRQVEYRDVVGFPGYRVGDDGSLWSRWNKGGHGLTDQWCRLTPGNCRGYHLYGLRKNGRQYSRLVHRLVLEAFVVARPEGMECCHGDGDRGNNALSNLRWGTRKENHQDSFRHGTRLIGSRHPNAECTEKQIQDALLLLARGFSSVEVSDLTGVPLMTVSRVSRGKSWKITKSSGKRMKELNRTQTKTAVAILEQLVAYSASMPDSARIAAEQALQLIHKVRDECMDWWDL